MGIFDKMYDFGSFGKWSKSTLMEQSEYTYDDLPKYFSEKEDEAFKIERRKLTTQLKKIKTVEDLLDILDEIKEVREIMKDIEKVRDVCKEWRYM